jgi:alkylation response protein AidB-like acyl-CoA dehydrogenase
VRQRRAEAAISAGHGSIRQDRSLWVDRTDVGSGASGGLTTTARRDGDSWILNGQKKWIGNATFGDLTVIWARDVADGQVKGFVVANDTPGFSTTKLEDKIALRIVQNAVITLEDVRVDEADRLANANSFRDTAEVLRMTRAGVAWMAVGCARGAYENALVYAVSREQFGRPIAGFQLVQDLLVRMLGNITSSWACVAAFPNSRTRAAPRTGIRRWRRRGAQSGCAKPSDMRGNCSAATESCWSTMSDASSPMPRRSTPTKARGR